MGEGLQDSSIDVLESFNGIMEKIEIAVSTMTHGVPILLGDVGAGHYGHAWDASRVHDLGLKHKSAKRCYQGKGCLVVCL